MPEHVNPSTPAEWQEAVSLAEFHLLLHSAQCYGLVTGGPQVNVERCEDILTLGRKMGYVPANDVAERYAPLLAWGV